MTGQHFDITILGGGPAGYQAAIRAAQLGKKVALVEARHLGGICLNHGCIPTKTIKSSVDLLQRIKQAKAYGLEVGEVRADVPAIIARKTKVVNLLKGSISQLLHGYGITVFEGWGRFASPRQIIVDLNTGEEICLTSAKVILATGSRAVLPKLFTPFQDIIMTTDEILNISKAPSSLLIIGAGAIGVEMAFIMAGLGTTVTLIEALDRILPKEDAEMSEYLTRMLKRQRIKVITGSTVQDVQYNNEFTIRLSDGQELQGEAMLVAAGRAPNLDKLALETIGLNEGHSYLQTNERMETTVPGIYAAGDISGGWLLAHVASAEGITAAENAAGLNSILDYRVIPRCTFSMPEFAAVGLTTEEAKEKYPIQIVTFPFKGLGMAQAMGEWEGLVKLVVHTQTEQILGGHIIGPHASDLIAEITLAMQHNITASGIAQTIHTHPTLSEAIQETAQEALGKAIHVLPRQ